MGDDPIVALVRFLVWGIVGSAAFIVFLKAAMRRISLRGLLGGADDATGLSPSRVQLLFLTLIGAFGYLGQVVHGIGQCMPAPGECALPSPPTEILALLGGSHGVYLGAKGLLTGGWLDRLRGN
jgi:hypothetical protein